MPVGCTLNDIEHFKNHAPKILHALEKMKQYSPIGKQLYDWAKENHIYFTEKEMSDSLGMGGQDVICNSKNSATTNISIIAHELMHVIQYHHNSNIFCGNDSDYRSFIIRGNGLEAGAVTCEFRVLYEMKLNGYPKAWDIFMKNEGRFRLPNGKLIRARDKYKQIADHFELAFKNSIKSGLTTDEAMQNACNVTHEVYNSSQALMDVYNSIYLKSFLNQVTVIQAKNSTITIDDIRDMVKIGEDGYLIDEVKMKLDDDALFGNNNLMRQAFEYIEVAKLEELLGKKNCLVIRKMEKIKKDNNPYIGINLTDISFHLCRNKDKNILEIMNDMVGIKIPKQLSLDFFAAASPKNKKQQRKWERKQKFKAQKQNAKPSQNRFIP